MRVFRPENPFNSRPAKTMDTKNLNPETIEHLKPFAPKYMWWKTPDQAVLFPYQLIAKVMDLGTFEDTRALIHLVGVAILKDVIRNAEIGWFRPRSWHFWHYKLNLAGDIGEIPPVPGERFV